MRIWPAATIANRGSCQAGLFRPTTRQSNETGGLVRWKDTQFPARHTRTNTSGIFVAMPSISPLRRGIRGVFEFIQGLARLVVFLLSPVQRLLRVVHIELRLHSPLQRGSVGIVFHF